MQTQAGREKAFRRLAKSKFRSRFHLSAADRQYIAEKGMETIRRHCEDFIRARLAPPTPPNDGRQTPMRGHPVFLAQHACACCCRGCMEKWWKVPKGTPIPPARQARIVDFLMAWIEKEYSRGQESGVRGLGLAPSSKNLCVSASLREITNAEELSRRGAEGMSKELEFRVGVGEWSQ